VTAMMVAAPAHGDRHQETSRLLAVSGGAAMQAWAGAHTQSSDPATVRNSPRILRLAEPHFRDLLDV
jgi:hypothetical protein